MGSRGKSTNALISVYFQRKYKENPKFPLIMNTFLLSNSSSQRQPNCVMSLILSKNTSRNLVRSEP